MNTVIINLTLPEETLVEHLNKYHRRIIKRTNKKEIEIKVFNSLTNKGLLEQIISDFQKAHYLSAGRATRPQETWDAMLYSVNNGYASIFVSYHKDIPISYLFCGEFAKMSFGWSQVNVEEYEEDFSPRHLLEWFAILHYKKNGFKYYEVGERYFGPQLFHIPSEKEMSISIFKERYGGALYPKIIWVKYFEKEYFKKDIFERINTVIEKQFEEKLEQIEQN